MWAVSFDDIKGHPYAESIEYLADTGVVKGYGDGIFGPDKGVTRAEMAKIVLKWLLSDEELGNEGNCFDDVSEQRFSRYICFAKQNDIVKWYPDNSFKPNQWVTMAEGFKIALEAYEEPVEQARDGKRYTPYIEYVHDQGLFSKHGLQPNQKMTRAQMSYLTHQLALNKTGEVLFSSASVAFDNEEIVRIASDDENASELSHGCEAPSLPSIAPTSTEVRGIQRSFISSIGDKVKAGEPTKLIIAFHGRTSPNAEVRKYYGLEKAWDEDAIILYPAGLPEAGPSRNRRATGDPSDEMRGFEFFDAMVEDISHQYCIDKDEIYVVGHSLGAWFTHSLACARGDVIRATGSVWWSTTANECTWTTASLIMHNPNDRLASFSGWVTARDQLLEQNSCWSETSPVWPPKGNCVEYTNCAEWAPVVWCPHSEDYLAWNGAYYPHTWPSFAGEMIWEFFQEYE